MREIDSYIKQKRLELSTSILHRKIIYLDINYWIRLRDQKTPIDKRMFDRAIELVKSQNCIFPISEISFFEILKQKDKRTLKATIELVDKLSEGIAIISAEERMQLELMHFIRKRQGKATYNIKELAWTKLVSIVTPAIIPSVEFNLQKSFYDFVCKMTLSEIITTIELNGGIKPFAFKDNVKKMNNDKEKYAHENKSFKQMFLSELSGFLEVHKESLDKTFIDLCHTDLGYPPSEKDHKEIIENSIVKLIYHGFRLSKITKELPMFKILPTMYAAVRWNTNRKYTDGNDTPDFMHVACALPYCDYFFTEKELRTIIAQQNLDTLFDCVVESDPNEAIRILDSINDNTIVAETH